MSLTVDEKTTFKSVEPGTYVARCIRLIDIGTQHNEYQGRKQSKKQVIITWELPTELISEGEYEGQPYIVSRFYTASLGEKANLRKDLEAWRGRAFTQKELEGFSLKNILDKPCLLSIVHNEDGRARVGGVMALTKGMTVPDRINPLISFDISEWDDVVFAELSDGIKELIKKSDEYSKGNEMRDNPPDDTTEGGLEPF